MMHSCCGERKMCVWSLCLIFFSLSNTILVTASSSSPVKHLCRQDQKDALWEFKNEFYVEGPHAYKPTEMWKNDIDCCSWNGVSCDPKTGKVVVLYLSASSLRGGFRFNSGLFKLQHLQYLDLGDNNISGVLPDSIGNFKYLKLLNLGDCGFFRKIPSSLGNLSYLTNLNLSRNDFTGELPGSMGNLNRLASLNLGMTRLSGNFPHALLNLSELTYINLGSSQFEGKLPSNMSSLSKLKTFSIKENSFSGYVPSSLFIIPSLIHLYLNGNNFVGPLEIGNISSSSNMELVGSSFAIYHTIDISGNRLEGNIPESIGLLKKLIVLNMSNNAFTGHIPPSLANLTNLESLDLSQNALSGNIPREFGKLKFLSQVNFSYNMLEGLIPPMAQFESQDSSSFIGNPGLFGAPLQEAEEEEEEESEQVISWIAAAIGYAPGIVWGFTLGR